MSLAYDAAEDTTPHFARLVGSLIRMVPSDRDLHYVGPHTCPCSIPHIIVGLAVAERVEDVRSGIPGPHGVDLRDCLEYFYRQYVCRPEDFWDESFNFSQRERDGVLDFSSTLSQNWGKVTGYPCSVDAIAYWPLPRNALITWPLQALCLYVKLVTVILLLEGHVDLAERIRWSGHRFVTAVDRVTEADGLHRKHSLYSASSSAQRRLANLWWCFRLSFDGGEYTDECMCAGRCAVCLSLGGIFNMVQDIG